LLRTTGSPQQDGPNGPSTQRIGNRPNLRQMISQTQSITTVPLYRYWNPGNADHFYTTNWAELGSGNYGWGYEGVQCHVLPQQRTGSIPLYRYWNPGIGDHFYTTNWAELGSGRYGWGYEGIQCYVYPTQAAGRVPLYRYWNAGNADHFYTTSWAELGYGNYGWGYEGIQCYVYAQPASPPSAGSAPSTSEEENKPSMDESPSTAYPSGEPSGEASGGLSLIPSTFMMGTANALSGAADPSRSERSFRTSKTGEGFGQAPQGGSFTMLDSSKPGQGKATESSGQVSISINMSPRTNDET
jgi:hypothetical protein